MKLLLDDSRRLTGPNLLSPFPGAIMDVLVQSRDVPKVIELWQKEVRLLLDAVGWTAENTFVRPFKNGVSLAISAPIDALYAATEVNEAAFNRVVEQLDGKTPDPVLKVSSTLLQQIKKESNPALLALKQRALQEGVCFLSDDDFVSVGMGVGCVVWPVDDLPKPESVKWAAVSNVPLIQITGTNGKSTTVRLLATILEKAGLCTGLTSTDYIKVGDEILDKGDYSGPGGARTIIRDKRVEAVVLEVARGGILRRGLAVDHADAALITNVAKDHLHEYGIDTVDELREVKFVVSKALEGGGVLVLNADDEGLIRQAKDYEGEILWFSNHDDNPHIKAQIKSRARVCIVKDKKLVFVDNRPETKPPVVAKYALLSEVPICMDGAAGHNISNSLAAIGLAKTIGIQDDAISAGLKAFKGGSHDNPGRGNFFEIDGVRMLVDFAHNVHGANAIVDTIKAFEANRHLLLIGQGGDRSNGDIRALTSALNKVQPDHIIITELPGYLRGRKEGEMSSIIHDKLTELGVTNNQIEYAASPLEGVELALKWGHPGDFLLLLVHTKREEVFELLQNQQGVS